MVCVVKLDGCLPHFFICIKCSTFWSFSNNFRSNVAMPSFILQPSLNLHIEENNSLITKFLNVDLLNLWLQLTVSFRINSKRYWIRTVEKANKVPSIIGTHQKLLKRNYAWGMICLYLLLIQLAAYVIPPFGCIPCCIALVLCLFSIVPVADFGVPSLSSNVPFPMYDLKWVFHFHSWHHNSRYLALSFHLIPLFSAKFWTVDYIFIADDDR